MTAMFWRHLSDAGYLPPLTSPLVLMAERDSVVSTHTIVDIPMMMRDWTGRKKCIHYYGTNTTTVLHAGYRIKDELQD
jgi:hypothetical protein